MTAKSGCISLADSTPSLVAHSNNASEDHCSWSEDGAIPHIDDFEGWRNPKDHKDNLMAVQPTENLLHDYAHNQNLVIQFKELLQTFQAWRPVRGDGNCYYRAILFAWFEHALTNKKYDDLNNFLKGLKTLKELPRVSQYARTCYRLLKNWISKRQQCSGQQSELFSLLMEVVGAFNNHSDCDYAFILCLRHLVSHYLHEHAKENVDSTESAEKGEGASLTYEGWAAATGVSLDDFCSRSICVMNEDASDLVQFVCPRVLHAGVRIIMVAREGHKYWTIDYGVVGAPLHLRPRTELAPVGTLTSMSSACGQQPDIFLLLKPGHYDILMRHNAVTTFFLETPCGDFSSRSEGSKRLSTLNERVGTPFHQMKDPSLLRQHADLRWTHLLQLQRQMVNSYQEVLNRLEHKLVEEMVVKQQRVGSIHESMFEAQLGSLLEPLQQAFEELESVPSSPFAGERCIEREPVPPRNFLPSLTAFLKRSRGDGQDWRTHPHHHTEEWSQPSIHSSTLLPHHPAPGHSVQLAFQVDAKEAKSFPVAAATPVVQPSLWL